MSAEAFWAGVGRYNEQSCAGPSRGPGRGQAEAHTCDKKGWMHREETCMI
jgi:hypothetical protein